MRLNFSFSPSLSVWHCQLKWVLCSPLCSFLPLSGALMGGGRDLSSIPSAIIPLLPLPKNIGLFSTSPLLLLFSLTLSFFVFPIPWSRKAMKFEKTMLSLPEVGLFMHTEMGKKVDLFCYATARQGKAEISRNLGPAF